MANKLYVLVLDGNRPRKVHAPDCSWVAGATAKGELKGRRYELRPAGSVHGEDCRKCGGTPGPATGGWPIRD
jgi:hypothetical protein